MIFFFFKHRNFLYKVYHIHTCTDCTGYNTNICGFRWYRQHTKINSTRKGTCNKRNYSQVSRPWIQMSTNFSPENWHQWKYMNPQYIPKLSALYCWSHCSTDKHKAPSAGVSSEIKCMCFTVCQVQGYIISLSSLEKIRRMGGTCKTLPLVNQNNMTIRMTS